MKDVQQLLAEKETELARLQKEIQSLQMILPLLSDDAQAAASDSLPEAGRLFERKPPENASLESAESQATGTQGAAQSESRLWSFAKRWRNK